MDLKPGWPARAVAAVTVAYGIAIAVAPKVLARPAGLVSEDRTVPPAVANLIRSIGVRDAALSTALALAPAGFAMRSMTWARVAIDGADAFLFSRLAADRSAVLKVSGVAGGWALVQALVGLRGVAARGLPPVTVVPATP
ncbi:hypothetical protein GIS00_13345 [Nakamurella sp. YIM 132087]|uniref:DUF4267 domain-containing protein n=1 Tax=Nakamurella alba TaxID=2665158 RepID=A0A7K1FLA1_9ACTN|nr:hypothetical protein [Nakamurella alba]MTD14925.1 hypothetical protein [Nakamurella alba]